MSEVLLFSKLGSKDYLIKKIASDSPQGEKKKWHKVFSLGWKTPQKTSRLAVTLWLFATNREFSCSIERSQKILCSVECIASNQINFISQFLIVCSADSHDHNTVSLNRSKADQFKYALWSSCWTLCCIK